jgi:hypothetical protein
MLGYEDVINSRDYTTSVICQSETGALYKLSRNDFNNMMKIDDKNWQSLVDMANQSDQNVLKIIKNGSINIAKHQLSRNKGP